MSALDAQTVLAVCRRALEQYGNLEVEVWPREESAPPGWALVLYMPARLGAWEGFKLIRERPSLSAGALGEREAYLVVRRPASGRAWRLPADEITDARTGASGVLAASFLAPPQVKQAAIVGTGRVATSLAIHLDALAPAAFPDLRELTFSSRSAENRCRFREHLADRIALPLVEAPTAVEAVQNADIVLLAAASQMPVLEAGHLKKGSHVSAMSGSPFSHALAPSVLYAADLVMVDEMSQCLRSGEMLQCDLNRIRFARSGDRQLNIGDAAIGTVQRRPGDLTVAYLSGLAILDLALGIELVKSNDLPPVTEAISTSVAGSAGNASDAGENPEDDVWRPIP